MLATSLGAAAVSIKEGRGRIIARSRLLAPGLLALASIIVLLAIPDPEDLLDKGRWLWMLYALLAGVVRGHFMELSSDLAVKVVCVPRSPEVMWVAMAQAAFAAFQFAIEVSTGADNRVEPTIEFIMMMTAGYLLGRGVWAWQRALRAEHADLQD